MLRAVFKFIGEVREAASNKVYDITKEAVLWDFRKEGTVEQWDCITDKDVRGYSQASLEPNGKGTGAIFHGTLSTAIPQESSATHTGYCAIRSRPQKPTLFDAGTMDLSNYDGFELKVRGDGRRFIANLQSPGLARKDDVWQCFVFTRGGPEWETIRAKEVKENTVEYNKEFVARMIPKIDFAVLKAAAQMLGYGAELPDSVPENYEKDDSFLQKMHHVMLEVELIEGDLECPESGRKFPISEGIPNMLLTEEDL